MRRPLAPAWTLFLGVGISACDHDDGLPASACGPSSAVVVRVVDGDTVELDSGEIVRYLLVDTPELGSPPDCYAQEAADFNASIVKGTQVSLGYDLECEDHYGRLLAYLSVDERDINALLVERGYACVLEIPPNGAEQAEEFRALEAQAQAQARGMWGACPEVSCEHPRSGP